MLGIERHCPWLAPAGNARTAVIRVSTRVIAAMRGGGPPRREIVLLSNKGKIEPWQGVIFAIIANMQWQRAGASR